MDETSKGVVLEVFPYNHFAFRFSHTLEIKRGGVTGLLVAAASDMSLTAPKNAFRFMTQKTK